MMEYSVVDKGKDYIEVELSDKAVANALIPILQGMGVDAYSFGPHPLNPVYRLHIKGANPMKDLKKATDQLTKEWAAFKKGVVGKIPKK